jgi:uncharacterized membrane-anchored protein YhcB (DUF1043 family)
MKVQNRGSWNISKVGVVMGVAIGVLMLNFQDTGHE